MKKNFDQIMHDTSNEELIGIITAYSNKYEPEALTAAKKELEQRKIDDQVSAELERKTQEQKIIDDSKENQDLDSALKVLTCIFPMFITILLFYHYSVKGYKKKAEQLAKWTFFGFSIYMGGAFLIGLLVAILKYLS